MKKKVIRVVYDNGDELEYNKADYFDQGSFENDILKNLTTDVEEWAKWEYGLIDENDCKEKTIDAFSDIEIYTESEARGLYDDTGIQNTNILNDAFLDRFINIVNRGDNAEIENALQKLENKFKIG